MVRKKKMTVGVTQKMYNKLQDIKKVGGYKSMNELTDKAIRYYLEKIHNFSFNDNPEYRESILTMKEVVKMMILRDNPWMSSREILDQYGLDMSRRKEILKMMKHLVEIEYVVTDERTDMIKTRSGGTKGSYMRTVHNVVYRLNEGNRDIRRFMHKIPVTKRSMEFLREVAADDMIFRQTGTKKRIMTQVNRFAGFGWVEKETELIDNEIWWTVKFVKSEIMAPFSLNKIEIPDRIR